MFLMEVWVFREVLKCILPLFAIKTITTVNTVYENVKHTTYMYCIVH